MTRRDRPTLQPVLDAIARTAARLCQAHDAMILELDGDTVRHVAKYGRLRALRDVGDTFPLSRDWVGGRAMIDGKTVHVRDVTRSAQFAKSRGFARTTRARTFLATPLLRNGTALGAILIRRTRVRPFTVRQIALLKLFADQAAIAIENARLSAELEERNRDLTMSLEHQTATSELLKIIGRSSFDLQPVFEALAENAVRLCDGHQAFIFRFDGQVLRVAAAHNVSPELRLFFEKNPVAPGRGAIAGRAALERRTLHVHDVQTDPERTWGAHSVDPIRTVLTIPMLRAGEVLGVLGVNRLEVKPFSDRQVALLETFADQAVIAIENVRLFTELGARNRALTEALEQQTATGEILRVISRSPSDVQPVFDAIAASAARLCGAVNGLVIRFDGHLLHLAAHYNVDPERLAAVRQAYPRPPTRGALSGRAVLTRAVVHVPDVGQDPEYTLPASTTIGYRSVLAVPMMHEGAPLGTILVARDRVAPFSEAHIALIQTFADQAVIAIENVRLFNELRARTAQLSRSVDELTALGEVSRAISSTLDLDTVLNTIVARASELTGSDYCAVWEYDEAAETFWPRAVSCSDDEVVAVARKSRFRRGEGVQGQMAITHEPVQIPDIATGQTQPGLRDVLLRTGTRALLAVPLLRDDRLIGGLTINKKTPGEFPPETVELLKTFATQSALAINNARLFREIDDKSRQLELASRHKSQFLANMSHELRTPLNAILGYTELIADGVYGDAPERMREVLERVDKSGRHLLGLINDILDLSKIEAGQLALSLAAYSMESVAQTVAAQIGALAAEKQLGFEVAVTPDLPLGHGDERRLTQVLLNLVGNAIKFTDTGKVAVRVGTAGDAYVVSVSDTGPGIAEADREKIFEEFQQADTTRAKAKGGTGLGLAISRRIVEMHGGRMWVDSALGEGSTFGFSVPIDVEQHVVPARGESRA